VELGRGQLGAVTAILAGAGLVRPASQHDLAGISRALVMRAAPWVLHIPGAKKSAWIVGQDRLGFGQESTRDYRAPIASPGAGLRRADGADEANEGRRMTRQIVRQIGTRCFIGSVLIRGQGGHAREEEVGNAAVCCGQGVAASRHGIWHRGEGAVLLLLERAGTLMLACCSCDRVSTCLVKHGGGSPPQWRGWQ